MRKKFALSRIKITHHPYNSFIFATHSSYFSQAHSKFVTSSPVVIAPHLWLFRKLMHNKQEQKQISVYWLTSSEIVHTKPKMYGCFRLRFHTITVTIEENCSKKCQLTVIAAWRLPCELHDADRTAMTNFAFRRDITAHPM
ncbi:hypothetical protein T05_9303 [Trichinella murrelli]|uniref:Uncharacterized protein n=1 Tax=Trichinella murrelli TaxID=144512 RepID=A0A0V0TGC1_9BILA|nr:hypothetical protein T05_9303 [Trichinella murrelli]